jgi:hypothetical protein
MRSRPGILGVVLLATLPLAPAPAGAQSREKAVLLLNWYKLV